MVGSGKSGVKGSGEVGTGYAMRLCLWKQSLDVLLGMRRKLTDVDYVGIEVQVGWRGLTRGRLFRDPLAFTFTKGRNNRWMCQRWNGWGAL